MSPKPLGPRELGFYVALSQVGLEMAVPPAVGLWLDKQLGWAPWGVIGGGLVGFMVGMVHLWQLLRQPPADQGSGPTARER
jgi:F0F1-type ATP synthase assembly protein I